MFRICSVGIITLITFGIFCLWMIPGSSRAGVPIPGAHQGPTPFQSIFATGFTGGYGSFGSGTVAGAIGSYGRFVTGGASSTAHGGGHGGGGGYGK